jgi:predicted RecB family nuclease
MTASTRLTPPPIQIEMELLAGRVAFSPSDLSGFCACPHLAQLERRVALEAARRPIFTDEHAELIRRKGAEHEAAYLAKLEAGGRSILRVPPEDAARATEQAIRDGAADVIYQARLEHGAWRGYSDFLERGPDGLYEPVETKLARVARPEHLLQLCYYAEQVERLQGRLPASIHVEAGTGARHSFATADFMAYYRRVRARFEAAMAEPVATYPWPCEHCAICVWRRECDARLRADDHPVKVAGLGRAYVDRLAAARLTTLERLGDAPVAMRVEGLRPETFETLRHQAALQLHHRRTGAHRVDHLPPEPGRGFALMPEPSPGDVWLDLEGHPFYEPARGLEYLFGVCFRDDASGDVRYRAWWGTDRDGERSAFEGVIDWIVERRARHPAMHVYHYGDYERATLKRLMGEHGTREEAIDDFLRHGVLVDLHRVVRQALRASVESYSIKKVEALYGFTRTADVAGGAESTVLFERWLECGERPLLDAVERYNEDDCRSTVALHEWLLARRPADLPWRAAPEKDAPPDQALAASSERDAVRDTLLARSSSGADAWWLVAQLLDYHQREARPQWWEWFNRLEMDEDELIEESSAIGGLVPVGEPVPEKRSLIYELSYPTQEHKIDGKAADPRTKRVYRVRADDQRSVLRLWRDARDRDEPLPRALIPEPPINDRAQREAVLRFARSRLAGDGAYRALEDALERRLPRVRLDLPVPDAVLTLDRSYLFVQGPPGAGKTWQGAKAAVALMRAGRRIGVTSLSHKAINNLLRGIEREALAQGFAFRGLKKYSEEEDAHWGACIASSTDNRDFLDPGLLLVAGTGWLFARDEMDRSVDTLFVDEAGQVSLADAIASGTAAKNLVLLGDPNQLPQVSQGAHPEAAKASVLGHLLGDAAIVPPDRGIFLAQTWRLRPEPCAFTSEAYYAGALTPAPVCRQRSLDAGNGLHVILVEHVDRGQSSVEEADVVAAEARRLIGTDFTDTDGATRALQPHDVLVVAPYNAQVRALRARVPDGVRVGTVDKFQGQEAPVVIVSCASSSGADAPRGIQFAFARHRVNVATSRAQCRVVLVCAPRLLEAECRTVEQMRLMNAVCRFVELGT